MKKNQIALCVSLLCLILFVIVYLLYMQICKQKTIEGYSDGSVKAYLNYESRLDTEACYETNKYTEEQLFGDSKEKIVYGKVKETQPIVCLDTDVRDDKKYKYNAYLTKLKINYSICGDLKKGKEYWIFIGVEYSESSLKEGDEGIFIIQNEPMTLFLNNNKKKVKISGMIYRKLDYSYLLIDDNKGLDKLKNKDDVICYWKKNNYLEESRSHPRENEVSNTNKKSKDVTNIKEVEIEGKKIIDTVNLNLNDLTTTCMEKSPEIDNFIEDSDDVIEGVVESVEYFDCNGLPWSCLHVKTMDSLFGNIKKREKVEIYVMEGYTFSDYTQKYLIEYTGDERGMHQIGDKSIYILSKESPDSVFGENVYMRTYSCFSEYRYDELKNKYIEYDFKGDTKESSRDSLVNLIKNYFGN